MQKNYRKIMKKIFIADANQIDKTIISQRLKLIGYDVESSGEFELSKLLNNKNNFNVFILDIDLGKINFREDLPKIRKKFPLTPILLATNSANISTANDYIKLGANDYILKPYNIELIRSRIQNWLNTNLEKTINYQNTEILIVDDNEMNRDLLTRRLKKIGFSTDIAINGLDALEKTKKHKYNLILLDIMMPEKNGFEVLINLRSESNMNQETPVIMLSALNDTDNILRSSNLGANDYIVKPFNISQVQQRIFAVLSK
jgi:DNA-binding response OmpR family regulator